MTTASGFKRLSYAVIAGGLLASLTLGAGPAGADSPGGAGEEAPAPPPAVGGTFELPDSGSSTITSEGQALGLAVKVYRDTQDRPVDSFGSNFVPLIVEVTENGAPTTQDYLVFAYATDPNGTRMETQGCLERWYTSTTTPRGIFWCTVIVDNPDTWTHSAFVNKSTAEGEVPVNYGQAHVAIPCLTDEGCTVLESKGKSDVEIKGTASEVAFLSIHSVFGGAWFLSIGILLLLSLAGGRRFLSDRGTHYFESKLDRIITGAKATTLSVTGTGIYLMFRETAYPTPSTPDKLDAVFELPYGKPYFLSLFVKIGIYAVLVAFSFVVIKEARRRSTTVLASSGNGARRPARNVSADDIWGADNWEKSTPKGGGGTAVLVDEPQVITETEVEVSAEEEPTRKGVRLALLVTGLGAAGIWFCVVLLKHFHQLIEAAAALAAGGG